MAYIYTFIIALLLSGCSTLKVETDYDPSADLGKIKSFTIIRKHIAGEDTLVTDRIAKALREEMLSKGYVERPKDEAQLYFVFHTGVVSKTRIDTDYQHVNMYPYSYGYGYHTVVMPRTRTYTYQEAKLIVDALLPKENKIVWRGTAIDYLKDYDTPQKKTLYINKVLKALMKNFPN